MIKNEKPAVLLLCQPVNRAGRFLQHLEAARIQKDSPFQFIRLGDRASYGTYYSDLADTVRDERVVGCVALLFPEDRPAERAGNIPLEVGYWVGQRGDHELLMLRVRGAIAIRTHWLPDLASDTCCSSGKSGKLVDEVLGKITTFVLGLEPKHPPKRDRVAVGLIDNYGDKKPRQPKYQQFLEGLVKHLTSQSILTFRGESLRIEVSQLNARDGSPLRQLKSLANQQDFFVCLNFSPTQLRGHENAHFWLSTGYFLGRRGGNAVLIVSRRKARGIPSNLQGATGGAITWVTNWDSSPDNFIPIHECLARRCAHQPPNDFPPGREQERIEELQKKFPPLQHWPEREFFRAGYRNDRYETDLVLKTLELWAEKSELNDKWFGLFSVCKILANVSQVIRRLQQNADVAEWQVQLGFVKARLFSSHSDDVPAAERGVFSILGGRYKDGPLGTFETKCLDYLHSARDRLRRAIGISRFISDQPTIELKSLVLEVEEDLSGALKSLGELAFDLASESATMPRTARLGGRSG